MLSACDHDNKSLEYEFGPNTKTKLERKQQRVCEIYKKIFCVSLLTVKRAIFGMLISVDTYVSLFGLYNSSYLSSGLYEKIHNTN